LSLVANACLTHLHALNVLLIIMACPRTGHTSETPRDYLCNLGPDGRRRDADMRPELARGTVEFVAPKEYMVCRFHFLHYIAYSLLKERAFIDSILEQPKS
jgi:hypothetical protein